MTEDFYKLIGVLCVSVLVGFIIIIPTLIYRLLKRKQLIPEAEKIESPMLFYIGIIFCCVLSISAFLKGMPYVGSAIILILLIDICMLVAYKKGKL